MLLHIGWIFPSTSTVLRRLPHPSSQVCITLTEAGLQAGPGEAAAVFVRKMRACLELFLPWFPLG